MAIGNYVFNSLHLPEGVDWIFDDVDPDYTYLCFAKSGTLISNEGWAICRVEKNLTNKAAGRWANGQGFNIKPNNGVTYNGRTGYAYAAIA